MTIAPTRPLTPARVQVLIAGQGQRVAAGAGLLCGGVHLVLLPLAGWPMAAMTVPMLALSAVCAFCASRILCGRGTKGEAGTMAATSLAMVLTHLLFMHSGVLGLHPSVASVGGPDAIELLTHAGVSLAASQLALLFLARIVVGHRS